MTSKNKTAIALNIESELTYHHCVVDPSDKCIFEQADVLPFNNIQQVLSHLPKLTAQMGVIVATKKGVMQWVTKQAEHLLGQYFSLDSAPDLPDTLRFWVEHQALSLTAIEKRQFLRSLPHTEQENRHLTVYLFSCLDTEQYIFFLFEQKVSSWQAADLQTIGLTQREAEVLFWVAKDKSNSEAAKILDCREGTVRKHLENIYKKLGVQSRVGAMMVALELLGILNS